jgi:transcriptional regulator with GAF, ATPase, and Fis domain
VAADTQVAGAVEVLFGHERGSFTGSTGLKQGLFELADGGTLFLDEIGDMPLPLQAKLLRMLESGEFRRVGGQTLLRVNVRVVCATNRHLWDEVKAGRFREDLYYRIACMSVHLPSLRERIPDLPVLADCLLEAQQQPLGRRHELADDALQLLERHDFPGNIRELRNILSAAAALAPAGTIHAEHIDQASRHASKAARTPAPDGTVAEQPSPNDKLTSIGSLEARHIEAVLRAVGGHKTRAAETLGISTRTLYRKMKRYGIG